MDRKPGFSFGSFYVHEHFRPVGSYVCVYYVFFLFCLLSRAVGFPQHQSFNVYIGRIQLIV